MSDRATEQRRLAAKKTLWGRLYRARMRAGLEMCRCCGRPDEPGCGLTFDHIVALQHGGTSTFGNITILCHPCNQRKAAGLWTLTSLAEEEALAPPEQQWRRLVYADLYQRRYDCPQCAARVLGKTNSRLSIHSSADGQQRCPGSHLRVGDDSVQAVLETGLAIAHGPKTPVAAWAPIPPPREDADALAVELVIRDRARLDLGAVAPGHARTSPAIEANAEAHRAHDYPRPSKRANQSA